MCKRDGTTNSARSCRSRVTDHCVALVAPSNRVVCMWSCLESFSVSCAAQAAAKLPSSFKRRHICIQLHRLLHAMHALDYIEIVSSLPHIIVSSNMLGRSTRSEFLRSRKAEIRPNTTLRVIAVRGDAYTGISRWKRAM